MSAIFLVKKKKNVSCWIYKVVISVFMGSMLSIQLLCKPQIFDKNLGC